MKNVWCKRCDHPEWLHGSGSNHDRAPCGIPYCDCYEREPHDNLSLVTWLSKNSNLLGWAWKNVWVYGVWATFQTIAWSMLVLFVLLFLGFGIVCFPFALFLEWIDKRTER